MTDLHLDDELDAFLTQGFAVDQPPFDDFSRETRPFTEAELRQVERALEAASIRPARDLPPDVETRRRLVDAALELMRERL